MSHFESVIRELLAPYASVPSAELDRDANILRAGGIKSLNFVQFIMDLEAHFQVPVVTDDFDLEEFLTIAHIDRFLQRVVTSSV